MGRKVSVSSFLFVVHGFVGEHGEERNSYVRFKIALGFFYAYYFCLCAMLIVFYV
jgi:hypothetical protein